MCVGCMGEYGGARVLLPGDPSGQKPNSAGVREERLPSASPRQRSPAESRTGGPQAGVFAPELMAGL